MIIKKIELTDMEAQLKVKKNLGITKVAKVKSHREAQRDVLSGSVKRISGLSQHQALRIIGAPSLTIRA